MRNNIVILGAIWGDEGKGKVTDLYAKDAKLIGRGGGGPNAGHTMWFNGKKYVTHMLPSGVLHKDVKLVLGQGMVIDPIELVKEMKNFEDQGINFQDRLYIDPAVHIILPRHPVEDGAREDAAGKEKFGTTKKGISPCYADKHRYTGLRLIDFFRNDQKIVNRMEKENLSAEFLSAITRLYEYQRDVSTVVNEYLDAGKRVVLEGAQGILLDIDHGQWPYVTSSSTTAGGICTGLGLSPHKIGEILGVVKAYGTKMNESGPLRTEITGELGEKIRSVGGEYGATTGRPRRIGWLDLPLLAYAHRVTGFTSLALTKIDCLRGIHPIQICVEYWDVNTHKHHSMVAADTHYAENSLRPVYQCFDGFDEDISGARTFDALPATIQKYIKCIETAVGVPVDIIGVGTDREQIIVRKDLWK